jgi:hypothetical protein
MCYLAPEIELHFINSEAATFRIMRSSIASVQVAENLKKYIYSGKDHVRNETGADLVVKHNAGTGNYKFFSQALISLNNEIVQFVRFTADNANFRLQLNWCQLPNCTRQHGATSTCRKQM